jgi:hypothetical protein
MITHTAECLMTTSMDTVPMDMVSMDTARWWRERLVPAAVRVAAIASLGLAGSGRRVG